MKKSQIFSNQIIKLHSYWFIIMSTTRFLVIPQKLIPIIFYNILFNIFFKQILLTLNDTKSFGKIKKYILKNKETNYWNEEV